MNKGLAEAEGDYVVFLNAGDTFHDSDTLQTIADAIMIMTILGWFTGRLIWSTRNGAGWGKGIWQLPRC